MGLVGVIRKARFSNVRTPTGETGVQDRYSNTFTPEGGKAIYDWPWIDEDMTSTLTPEQRKQIHENDMRASKWKAKMLALDEEKAKAGVVNLMRGWSHPFRRT